MIIPLLQGETGVQRRKVHSSHTEFCSKEFVLCRSYQEHKTLLRGGGIPNVLKDRNTAQWIIPLMDIDAYAALYINASSDAVGVL